MCFFIIETLGKTAVKRNTDFHPHGIESAGMYLSWTFPGSESLQPASRGSKKAARELLGGRNQRTGPKSQVCCLGAVGGGDDCWLLAESRLYSKSLKFWSNQVQPEHFVLKREQWWHAGWWWWSPSKPQCVFPVPLELSELSLF